MFLGCVARLGFPFAYCFVVIGLLWLCFIAFLICVARFLVCLRVFCGLKLCGFLDFAMTLMEYLIWLELRCWTWLFVCWFGVDCL